MFEVFRASGPIPHALIATLGTYVLTAIGTVIGLQNVPEGFAIALPLRRGGMTRGRAFFWGQFSAAIEPVAGVIGAALVLAH